MASREPFFFAGLWDEWREGTPERLPSFTILTTHPNDLCKTIHDRMALIVSPKDYELWLDTTVKDVAKLEHVMQPYPAEEMMAHPVSTRVNKPENEREELIEPVQS